MDGFNSRKRHGSPPSLGVQDAGTARAIQHLHRLVMAKTESSPQTAAPTIVVGGGGGGFAESTTSEEPGAGTNEELAALVAQLALRVSELGMERITYTHVQHTESGEWEVVHNLGRKPGVTVMDTAGTVYLCAIKHVSDNALSINLGRPMMGSAICE